MQTGRRVAPAAGLFCATNPGSDTRLTAQGRGTIERQRRIRFTQRLLPKWIARWLIGATAAVSFGWQGAPGRRKTARWKYAFAPRIELTRLRGGKRGSRRSTPSPRRAEMLRFLGWLARPMSWRRWGHARPVVPSPPADRGPPADPDNGWVFPYLDAPGVEDHPETSRAPRP